MKILKNLSVFAMAFVAMFVFGGCNTETFIKEPTQELRESFDSALTGLGDVATGYKINVQSDGGAIQDGIEYKTSESWEVIVTGEGDEVGAKVIYKTDMESREPGETMIRQRYRDFYLEKAEDDWTFYETYSVTKTVAEDLSAGLVKIGAENNLGDFLDGFGDMFAFDGLANFASEDSAYTDEECKIYDLGNKSYRADLVLVAGSMAEDSEDTQYSNQKINITFTDGKITKIVMDIEINTRETAEDAWESMSGVLKLSIAYGSFEISIPDKTYETVDFESFSNPRFS